LKNKNLKTHVPQAYQYRTMTWIISQRSMSLIITSASCF